MAESAARAGEDAAPRGISRALVLTLAAGTGVTAANLYYAQPLLATIAAVFHASPGAAGMVVTLSQAGYGVGLLSIVPLGDVRERRTLILTILSLSVLALLGAALAPSLAVLLLAALAIGLTSVVAQILVPFSAGLAREEERGRTVGTVMSGLLLGILLARTFAGSIAQALGWRWVYAIAAGLMIVLGFVLRAVLPRQSAGARLSYPALIGSVLALLRDEPLLRRRSAYGALTFGAFSVFWTTVAFLLSRPPYGYGEAVIGLFGLIGVVGALTASVAGRLADRGLVRPATGGFIVAALLSYGLLALGAHLLWALIAGIVLLDLGVQGAHISNQSLIYRLDPRARTRITGAYMTMYFIGGSLGSALASLAYGHAGWGGVCVVGGSFTGAAFLLWLTELRLPTRAAERRAMM